MSPFFSDTTNFRDSVTDSLNQLDHKVNLILKYLNIFYEKDSQMAYDISALVTAVENEKTVEASLLSLVQGLSQKVASMATEVMDDATKAKLADLALQLNSNATDMAAAVKANTPVVTAPVSTDNTQVAPNVVPAATTDNAPATTAAATDATGTASPAEPAVSSSTTPTANS